MMTPQDQRVKRKVRILKNSRLRKVRYELRTLHFLLFENRKRALRLEISEVRADHSINYDGRREKLKKLLKERNDLILSFSQHPINCSMCGNREGDLIFRLEDHVWVCYNSERCRQRVELHVQEVQRLLKNRGFL